MTIPEFLHHPFDLGVLYEVDAYIALCYSALSNQEKALEHAELAYDNISPMPHSPYKGFHQMKRVQKSAVDTNVNCGFLFIVQYFMLL